jgi:uncharacterized protein (DUF427 family)
MAIQTPTTNGVECFPSQKWVRVYFNGQIIADSRRCILLRSQGRPAEYYFPKQDVVMEYLTVAKPSTSEEKGKQQQYWDVRVGDQLAVRAAREYAQLKDVPSLDGYLALDWSSMDAWFEEQEEVFVHPRDPRVRLDILHSNRHVKAIIRGETVAESRNPILMFETGLPVRYYLPKTDVRQDLLIPSQLVTRCPYKGEAQYYSVKVGDQVSEDVVWYYQYPTAEAAKIASYLSFYEEKIDALEVDGERRQKV